MSAKKLYKNKRDAKLCGVCSGIADYFNIDPTIVRLHGSYFSWLQEAELLLTSSQH